MLICLVLFYLILSSLFRHLFIFQQETESWKTVHPDGKGAGEDLVGVEEEERVIRKYCMKISPFIKR